MKALMFLKIMIICTFCLAQTKVKTVSRAYFSYQNATGTTHYYQKGKYEIFLDANNKIGVRNIPSGVALISPKVYSVYTVNDTAYSTIDSVILKLKLNIFR